MRIALRELRRGLNDHAKGNEWVPQLAAADAIRPARLTIVAFENFFTPRPRVEE